MTDPASLDMHAIQSLGESLADLPDAWVNHTKRAIVALLASDIQSARSKGYTLKAIARHLRDRGFDINYNTLRDALPRQKKSRSRTKKPRAAAMPDGARTRRDGHGPGRDAPMTSRDGPMTRRDGHGPSCDGPITGRDETRMRAVAPPDGPGRDAIPPGAFARRPDLKDL